MRVALIAFLLPLFLLVPSARAQAPDIRPRLVQPAPQRPPARSVRLQIAELEREQHAAQGRASGWAALTIGGTALIVGGVISMVVVAAIAPEGCMGMPDCVRAVSDYAPGMTLTIVGALAVLVGAILWADADSQARSFTERIRQLREAPVPDISLGPDSLQLSLRGHF